MIITDGTYLVSTESDIELHAFAKKLKLKSSLYMNRDHYNNPIINSYYEIATPIIRQKAIHLGATFVMPSQLIKMAWREEEK